MEGVEQVPEPSAYAWTLDGVRIALQIDTSIYSTNAVLKTAYKFTDRLFVILVPGEGSAVVAILSAKAPRTDLATLVGEFQNELLDQRLREVLECEFGAIRNLLVAQAFSEGNLLRSETDDDYERDPDGALDRR